DVLKAKLGGQKGPKSPIKQFDYFMVGPNEVIDGLSALNFASVLNPNAAPSHVESTALAWHLYNEQTLIVAEVNQLEQFLQGGRQPAQRTQLTDSDPGAGIPGGAGEGGMRPGGPMGPT